ncbi:unnamed protein product [Hermetia illucens]|uniref:Iron-sulfur cluster assembly 2 homolog, mitochondrial n=1 Tax=Hermetia illucens TaxID=343691 RepID=A0A7R8V3W9_HERIL|nr:iron-sulfur cluster assembly 2 homolog, mitochondrial [Hermetia illucens]CAD7092390.1 unnamed protein product [Hermetia illucens]
MAAILRHVIRASAQRSFPVRLLNSNEVKNQSNAPNVSTKEAPASDAQILNLSDSCKKRLEEICTDGSFLRLTVEGGGCSGFQYKFDLDNKLNEDDLSFGTDKAKVVVDNISIEYCNGATVDFHTELIRSGFRIVGNPKAEQGCSCGASFAIRLD